MGFMLILKSLNKGGMMNLSDWDVLYKAMTTLWSELMSFGLVLAGFYAIWLVVSAILKWGRVI